MTTLSVRCCLRAAWLAVAMAFTSAAASAQGLAALYDAALRNNPNLQLRDFEVERARADADGARSRLLPQLGAQAAWSSNAYRDSATDRHYGGQRASLNARQALYDPASWTRVQAARATIVQREQERAQVRDALLGELLERYLQVLAAQDDTASLAAESEAAHRQVDRLRVMRERQMAKVTDLAEAQAYAQGLATRDIDADNERAVALARLTELCGETVAQVPPMVQTTFDPPPGTAQQAVADALQRHPRLLALAQALEATRRSVEASRAEHLPLVSLVGSHVYTDQGFDNRQQPAYHSTSLGVELRVPLYEGGRVDAAVREAAARLGAAERQLEAARREVERETLALWLSAQANRARIASTEGEVLALEQTVQAQETGLELGVSRVTDLLDARRRLLKARGDRSKARYGYLRDLVAIQIRRGDVAPDDIARWDRWFGP